MKILRHRNLLGCLFAVLLALPLINIGVRCGYVMWNKNAKESYYGETINQEISYHVNNIDDFKVSYNYNFNTNAFVENINTFTLNIKDFKAIAPANLSNYDSQINLITFTYDINTNRNIINFYNDTQLLINYTGGNIFNFNFYLISFTTPSLLDKFTRYEYNKDSYLDNAFSYSVSQITEGNNIGELKFFTWFADLFLDLDNPSNALYINFINWYFNYAILVSAVYILFLTLMWFINWVRKLLEKGMSFGQGSF